MGQLLKLWWMSYWRIWLVLGLLGGMNNMPILVISLMVALTLRFVFKKSIKIFPMWKLFNREDPVIDLRPRKRTPKGPAVLIGAADQTYAPGALTGYEPQRIEHVKISKTPLMHGTPGVGLSSSGFGAEAIALGQLGEENFAKTLSVALHQNGRPIIETTDTFWSVAMPSKYSASTKDPEFQSDIDCIVVSADTIYLLDLKYYTGGNVSYTTYNDQLLCTDLATGHPANEPKKMSRNMEMAQDRFKRLFPNMQIKSRVVFMPTERGIPRVTGVYWPGNIPAVGLMSMIDELSRSAPAATSRHASAAKHQIANLLKK